MHYLSTRNFSMHSPFPLDVLPFDSLPFNVLCFNAPPSTRSPSACSSHSLDIHTCRTPCTASTHMCTQNTPCHIDAQPRHTCCMQEALVNVQPRCPCACRTPLTTRSLDTHAVRRCPRRRMCTCRTPSNTRGMQAGCPRRCMHTQGRC
jgi:hypothetical protein